MAATYGDLQALTGRALEATLELKRHSGELALRVPANAPVATARTADRLCIHVMQRMEEVNDLLYALPERAQGRAIRRLAHELGYVAEEVARLNRLAVNGRDGALVAALRRFPFRYSLRASNPFRALLQRLGVVRARPPYLERAA